MMLSAGEAAVVVVRDACYKNLEKVLDEWGISKEVGGVLAGCCEGDRGCAGLWV